MQLVLTIKNNSKNSYESVTLFDCFAKKPKFKKNENCVGLPATVSVTVKVIDDEGKISKPSYYDVLAQLNMLTEKVNIHSSSNNRLLDFWMLDIYGGRRAMEPGLTKDKKPRPKKWTKWKNEYGEWEREWNYVTQWNPKKWNIADTQEHFILDNKIRVFLKLDKKSEFELTVTIHPRPKFNLSEYNGPKLVKFSS